MTGNKPEHSMKRGRPKTHGHTHSRLYCIWAGMCGRCLTPTNKAFDDYGGRGIKVAAEWQTYGGFLAWANASGYRDDLTLDRRDNDGNYEPDNCRWVGGSQQRLNIRKSRRSAGTSRFLGVSTHRNKFRARLKIGGTNVFSAVFDSETDAAVAYDKAKIAANGGSRHGISLNFSAP